MTDKISVLFLCTGNSARSQMAEAWLRHLGGSRVAAFSAGLEPKGVHPLTIAVLREAGIDASSHTSKHLGQFARGEAFDWLVTVCDEADKNCPTGFKNARRRLHWSFKDPAAATGSEEEKLAAFRAARDAIKIRVGKFLTEITS